MSSEVTSQIIYGEKFKIFSKNRNWIKIKSTYDNYIGYIENKKYTQNFNPKYKVDVLKAKIYDKRIFFKCVNSFRLSAAWVSLIST